MHEKYRVCSENVSFLIFMASLHANCGYIVNYSKKDTLEKESTNCCWDAFPSGNAIQFMSYFECPETVKDHIN